MQLKLALIQLVAGLALLCLALLGMIYTESEFQKKMELASMKLRIK